MIKGKTGGVPCSVVGPCKKDRLIDHIYELKITNKHRPKGQKYQNKWVKSYIVPQLTGALYNKFAFSGISSDLPTFVIHFSCLYIAKGGGTASRKEKQREV